MHWAKATARWDEKHQCFGIRELTVSFIESVTPSTLYPYSPERETTCNEINVNNKLPTLQWRHNGHDDVSNHQPHQCLLNRLFGLRSNKTSKLRVTGLCVGNSSRTGEFLAQMASNAENVSIWWSHRAYVHPENATYCSSNQIICQ